MARIRTITLLLATIGPAAAGSCDPGEDDPCEGVDCSSRGFCLSEGGSAYCVCLPGFHPEALSCVENNPADPCREVDCSGGGTCRIDPARGVATCDCFENYEDPVVCEEPDCDLLCVPVSTTDGGGTEDADADADAGADAPPVDSPPTADVPDGSEAADGPCDGLTLCGTACVDIQSDPYNCGGCGEACLVGADCDDGRCSCPVGRVACPGVCADVMTDPANCGGCNIRCSAGWTCSGGVCVSPE